MQKAYHRQLLTSSWAMLHSLILGGALEFLPCDERPANQFICTVILVHD